MKKTLFIVAAVAMLAYGGVLEAKDQFVVPSANTDQPAFAEYGGVLASTSNFSAAFATAATGPCVVYGVNFSSGDVSQFVQVYATGTFSWSGQGAGSTETIRIFNTAISSGGVNPSGSYSSSGYVPIGPFPVRFKYGCGFRPSTDDFSSIILLYMKE